ncbi:MULTISPECIES: D-aminoacyl-tRNA deacylase [Peptoniphilus]|jgi:D-tyrosyl-tRNA(Tyr) deacylase|uniref:D-aminoacyl-tRNA deacylase n=1 Tax=Peptoniphilus TaxID=162289 RepID=UPI0008D9EA3F|nr:MULTISPECIES: D-aminoacyl-tRNA deacylase [Peptoniphilus]MBS6610037.1 D-tyrosyl-tRNA(Tyr) deacylase [Peptoniphilus harei]MDU1043472.1 D-aminoacyl-tRNA deacylase [Peptoniphilus rhinitidis]MDU2109883.1 D-aminoacyl-tRNA deacylase [Peptoniphilus lacydonensis]MDU2115546.1 D-aminoacyl-tRNA deacylase [Peptoniphilus lacydonensis]MDU3751665.1 D-aminoacyl-tRNA deacylase [Peptoniphilus rhinitidis]
MRAVVQRVKSSSVSVDGKIISEIEKGLMVLLGVEEDDDEKDLEYILKKVTKLRIFDDEDGVMNKSLIDYNLEILVVSQFTLYGDVRKGNRPSYVRSAKFDDGIVLYEKFIEELEKMNLKVSHGEYGADMDVALVNDGPVTILLDSSKKF